MCMSMYIYMYACRCIHTCICKENLHHVPQLWSVSSVMLNFDFKNYAHTLFDTKFMMYSMLLPRKV